MHKRKGKATLRKQASEQARIDVLILCLPLSVGEMLSVSFLEFPTVRDENLEL